MPRPKKADHTRRTFILRVRFTETEKQALLANASQLGCNASDFVRLKSLDVTPRTTKAGPDRAGLIVGLGELGKIGSNLNQIARALNRRALTERGEWVPDQLIEHALHGVDTLTHHLINVLEHGSH